MRTRWVTIAALATALLSLATFFKIAWVTDDAYISFRSLEQLFDGNGPRWNPHERVQVYTSPLWFWLLAFIRLFSGNVFINAIVASAVLYVVTLIGMRHTLRNDLAWAGSIALLLASNGFFDYTSSGLENGLGYALLAVFLYFYTASLVGDTKQLRGLLAAFGLLLVCRHDMATLVAVPTAYAIWTQRRGAAAREWFTRAALALGPIVAWSLTSVIYYGAALPNTAYAKLSTGLPPSTIFRWGVAYFTDTLRHDTITVIGTVGGAVALLACRNAAARALGGGLLVNLVYTAWVGGDFMRGRFFAFAYFIAVIGICIYAVGHRRRVAAGLAILAFAYAMAYPHTPLNSARVHKLEVERPAGPIDERGFYWQASLHQYFRRTGDVFPDHPWALAGHVWGQSTSPFVERGVIGYFGYWAGTSKVIIDHFGLADPLLARLPADPVATYRVGHFRRKLPEGYREIVMTGQGIIIDPQLRLYYDKLRLITQGEPLFGGERLKTITAMNLGRYDRYLEVSPRSTATE